MHFNWKLDAQLKGREKWDWIKARRLRRFGKLKYTPPASCGCRCLWIAAIYMLWPQSTSHYLPQEVAIHELQSTTDYITPRGLRLADCGRSNPWAESGGLQLVDCGGSWIAVATIHNDVPQSEPFYTVPRKMTNFFTNSFPDKSCLAKYLC